MASKKRTGLGRGIGALIPQAPAGTERPVDVFFPRSSKEESAATPAGTAAEQAVARLKGDAASDGATSAKTARAEAASGQRAGGSAKARAAKKSDTAAAKTTAEGKANTAATGTAVAGTAAAGMANTAEETAAEETELREVPGALLTTLSVTDIVPNRAQPRREFDEDALAELTHSVKEFGVFQPIVVREIDPHPPAGEPRYELIMGERRLRASKRAGLETIPAIVRGTDDEHMLRDALLENLHRAQLNPLEEASAYQQLMSDFGITQEELASRIGRSRPQISNTIRLLRLPETVQAKVAAGVLSAGHARAILALDGDAPAMQSLADKIIHEGLSVRAAEEAANATPKRKRPKVRVGGRHGELDEIAERLGDRFNTRVHVKFGAKKGQIIIDFATFGDLRRILSELDGSGE